MSDGLYSPVSIEDPIPDSVVAVGGLAEVIIENPPFPGVIDQWSHERVHSHYGLNSVVEPTQYLSRLVVPSSELALHFVHGAAQILSGVF